MGQPRTGGRKKPIVLSSDDGEDITKAVSRQHTKRRVLETQDGNRRNSGSAPVVTKSSKSPPFDSTLSPDNSQTSLSQRTPQSSQGREKRAKSKSKTAYSFFNNAAQRQTSRKAETSSERVDRHEEQEDDFIVDDSVNDELIKLSEAATGPSHSLALRKRTRGTFEDAGHADNNGGFSGSQKFRKTSDGSRVSAAVGTAIPKATVSDRHDQRPWTDEYGPVNLEELAVHKKKVADVRRWLSDAVAGVSHKRLLILKGAAGTAKTITVSLLSRELGFDINEWRNPVGSDFAEEGYVSAAAQFEDFIGRTGRFASLAFAGAEPKAGVKPADNTEVGIRRIILIEEFPNTFARGPSALQSFRSTVQQYLAASAPLSGAPYLTPNDADHRVTPIVMIISETLLSSHTTSADNFTAHRLLGPEILTHPSVSVIEFNAVAPTILTKALELVVLKEARKTGRRKTPGPQVIQQLASIGDVRSAVSSLEFLCVRGDSDNGWGSKVTFTKPKGRGKDIPLTNMEQESLKMITHRESTLGIFHAVGKVVYNKREAPTATDTPPPQPPPHLLQHARSKIPEINVDTLVDELGTDIQTFIAALHENYVLSCLAPTSEETLDSINGCIDALSDADLLSPDRFGAPGTARRPFQGSSADSLRQDDISYQASVRGILFSLPFPVKRGALPAQTAGRPTSGGRGDAHRMFYPTSLKLWRQREETEGLVNLWVSRARRGELRGDAQRLGNAARHARPGGVETWRRNAGLGQDLTPKSSGPADASADGDGDAAAAAPALLAGGASARTEMLLERLPYLALVQRRRPGSSSGLDLRDVEKVTRFTGVGIPSDGQAEDEEGDALADVPVGKGSLAREDSLSVKGVAGLVLSDDDIEDE